MKSLFCYSAIVLVACLSGCDRAHIQSADLASLDISELHKIQRPDCVLDVDPGKIKRCVPDLNPDTRGVSGHLQIDGVRTHRNWAPMVAIELASADGLHKIRISFSVKEYKMDADGSAILRETPFKGTIERWTDINRNWSADLPVDMMPVTPLDFLITWNDDSSINLLLGLSLLKTEPLGFHIGQVAVLASGVQTATSNFGVLQPTASLMENTQTN